jgi:hypothetical protein
MSLSLRKILSLTSLIIVAGALPAASAAQATPGPSGFRPAPHRAGGPADPAFPGFLSGVAAQSSSNVWAVGRGPLIVHWNGTAWSKVSSPSPGIDDVLYGVAAVSPTAAWAVGYTCRADLCPHSRSLIQSWNGTSWSDAKAPAVGTWSSLRSVSATSASDAWAVGASCLQTNCTGSAQTMILHWNGTTWSQVASPSPDSSGLEGVTAISPTDAWAVGATVDGTTHTSLILHWNGTAWSQVTIPALGPSPVLNGVTAISPTDAWAFGSAGNRDLTLHWNGTAWSKVPDPKPVPHYIDTLYGVTATSASDAWAVGQYCSGVRCNKEGDIILHWNGTAWSQVQPPSGSGPYLMGVAAVSASDAWAVGIGRLGAQILHWNGKTWSQSAD